MTKQFKELVKIKNALEKQNKNELLTLIASCRAEIKTKDIESEIEIYLQNYSKLLEKKNAQANITIPKQ